MDDLSPNPSESALRRSGLLGHGICACFNRPRASFCAALRFHAMEIGADGTRLRRIMERRATCRRPKPRQKHNRNRSLSRNPSLSPNRSPSLNLSRDRDAAARTSCPGRTSAAAASAPASYRSDKGFRSSGQPA